MIPLWLLKLFGGKVGLSSAWTIPSGYVNPDMEPKRIRLLKLAASQVINDFEAKVDIDGNIIATFCNVATEGTVTHASGVCDTVIGTITPAISSMPVLRLYQ